MSTSAGLDAPVLNTPVLNTPVLNMPVLDTLGRALRDVRISVLDHCNYRCAYCMPAADSANQASAPQFLSAAQRLSSTELLTLIAALRTVGMQKLRLTGGEPLLRKDLPDVIAQVRDAERLGAAPIDIALTTNASLLSGQAQRLRAAGLDRLTISLDSLDPERFFQLSGGRGALAPVLAGIDAALAAGFSAIKFNCVVQRGINDVDVLALCEHFRHSAHVPRFIEYMDVGNANSWRADSVVPSAQLIERISARFPLRKLPATNGGMGEVAERYAYADGAGEIGFISSISTPFCRGCTRARVSADGVLYTCLFNASGHNLRPMLQTGDHTLVANAIRAIWRGRTDRYSELRAQRQERGEIVQKPEMYHLGG
jgi:GTP 3',8-cyclase